MCNEYILEAALIEANKPEKLLSSLIKDNTSVSIDPNILKMFIKLHWDKIIKLAHKIHENA